MKLKSQQGLTLIELLGAISVSAIIIGLVSSVFIGSVTNYNKTITHSDLRQEANLIFAELTEVHHKNPEYKIEIVNGLIQVTNYQQTWTMGNPNFEYSIPAAITITKMDDYLNLDLTIRDPKQNTRPYKTSTIINRR